MNLRQFNRILIHTLLLPVITLAFVAGVLIWQVTSAQRTFNSIRISDDVIARLSEAEKLIIDQETGLRGYQITSDPQFLQPYNDANAPLQEIFVAVSHALEEQHQSAQGLASVRAAYRTWQISFAEPLIANITAGGDTRGVPLNVRGKHQMDRVRTLIDILQQQQADIRKTEVSRWQTQANHTIVALVLLILCAGIFIGIFTFTRLHRVSDAYEGTLDGLRRHAQATYESEERLRTTLTSIGDGVILCTPDGRVEILNTVAQELTGWSQAEAYHRPLEDVFHIVNETTRQLVETPVAKVKRLNRIVGLANHTVLLRRNGTEINIDDSGAPVRDRTGSLTGIVLVFRDITDQRRNQDALMASEKLAVAGRLAASIAHEMHNPLDSVVNLLYLIRDEQDPQVSANYLSLAQQELNRMGQVSRAMLGLYRESKSPINLNIKELIESVLILLEHQLRAAGITLETSLAADLEIAAYPAELRQVFTNLITNAADAIGTDGVIRISARANTRSGSRTPSGIHRSGVIIEVADNGSGIEPAALQQLFEPFFTTKGESGTGLGLWISRGIIDKHGGTINVASRTGAADHGTTITISLPLVAVSSSATESHP